MCRPPSSTAWPILAVGVIALLASACMSDVSPTAPTPTNRPSVAPTSLDGAVAANADRSTLAAPTSLRVDVCHREGNRGIRLLNVSVSSLAPHRAHGDALVGEPVPAQPGKIFGPACSVVDAPAACEYSLSPQTRRVTEACVATVDTALVTVTAGCSWSATSNSGWLTVVSGGGPAVGTGAGQTITLRSLSNRHQDSRVGVITVLDADANPTSAVLTVTQAHGHSCP